MFVQAKADIACNFFEKVLKHTADDWYGKPFLLAPWEEEALNVVFGNVDDEGNRLIEMVYLEVPKKSGKSEFVAGIILLVLVLEAMKGCQIYGAASATRQALNVYRATTKMVEQSPTILQPRLRVLRGTNRIIRRSDPDSFYGAIAADGDLGDGVNPAVTIADELHRWKTRKQIENWDVLSNGGITRRQTLTIAITTAGVRTDSPIAWLLHEKTLKIKKGVVSDPKFYGRIYGADKDDDPSLESTWIKANPSLTVNGGFLPIEKIRQKYATHESEGDLTSFKRYFLNMWDQNEDLAIDMNKWDASAGAWECAGMIRNSPPMMVDGKSVPHEVDPLPADFMKRFIDRRCWVGGDISMTTDLTAIVFLFPKDNDEFDVLPFFWFPEGQVRKFERKLGVPLRQWSEQGFLQLSPGDVIDYREVRARLDWGKRMFDLREVCWDPWNSRQISVPMIDDGFKCVDIRQGYQTLGEPTKFVLKRILNRALHHGNHPVMRWNAGCAATGSDGKDNIMFTKPDRTFSSSRIDGISALTNAVVRAMVAPKPPKYKMMFV